MNVLIACEESQRTTMEFRKLGFIAYSADLFECSGGHPEWHIQGDVIPLLNGNCSFTTMDGIYHSINAKWDLIIAHPTCTYLSNAATSMHSMNVRSLEQINTRMINRIHAMIFFMKFIMADCDRIAVENPICVMNTTYRTPDQIIHPYQFAENEDDTDNYVTKATCLWLKGLPLLKTNNLPMPDNAKIFGKRSSGKNKTFMDTTRSPKIRSKTFRGIAKAFAEQWGNFINNC